jgi:hypothetical protein
MSIVKIPAPENLEVEEASTGLADEQREAAAETARSLLFAFAWLDSAEGQAFWDGVYNRLSQIAEDGQLK